MFETEEKNLAQNEKNLISDSVVTIESYISLAQNFIENNEEIQGLAPLYLAIEKIEDETKKIKQICETVRI